jgi:hypothetical protein
MINYLNDIITQNINHYRLCPTMTLIDEKLKKILITFIHALEGSSILMMTKNFLKQLQSDIYDLMNIYVIKHVRNSLTCYKTNVHVSRKLCKYDFL